MNGVTLDGESGGSRSHGSQGEFLFNGISAELKRRSEVSWFAISLHLTNKQGGLKIIGEI